MYQSTIRTSVSLQGVGLHSGKPARVTVLPAPPNSGIVFHTAGNHGSIPASPESVVDSHYATTLGKNGTRIQSIEHLMAAAGGLGIDNLRVELDGAEIPAVDGSAKPFVTLLRSAGRAPQSARRSPLVIPFPIRVGRDRRWIEIVPAERFSISYTLENEHPAIGTQALSVSPSERIFVEEFAPARTYGFLKDLGVLRRKGLARGGSLENAVVVGKRGVLNGLRYRDEFVRHKILDLIGDLTLLGRPVVGHVIAHNAGHLLNFELVVAIQKALGLDRRPVGVTVPTAEALTPVAFGPAVVAQACQDAILPAPGLAPI